MADKIRKTQLMRQKEVLMKLIRIQLIGHYRSMLEMLLILQRGKRNNQNFLGSWKILMIKYSFTIESSIIESLDLRKNTLTKRSELILKE